MHNISIDVDECVEDTDGCDQICTDIDGSYTCSCEVGYDLAEDQHGCDGKELLNRMNNWGFIELPIRQ